MANNEHLAILKLGVKAWNVWREIAFEAPELTHAHLRGAHLAGANLAIAQLSLADLREADLRKTRLFSAILEHTKLTKANLRGANLGYANLTDANLTAADLSGGNVIMANLSQTILQAAILDGVKIGFTRFNNCDLSEVRGLETVEHIGPSSIGIDTIYKSRGKIPESFLRGCGVQESFITQMHSLVDAEDGIQFYSCFISYSGKDENFARRLHGRMRDAHLRVWFAPEDVQGGKKLHEQIEKAIHVFDKLLIVLSGASLKSEWVMTELRKARKAERQSGKRKLFPVRLVDMKKLKAWECFDADSGKDLAVELREYFIPDFSNWKDHDQFETAFARLLKDLRSEERAK